MDKRRWVRDQPFESVMIALLKVNSAAGCSGIKSRAKIDEHGQTSTTHTGDGTPGFSLITIETITQATSGRALAVLTAWATASARSITQYFTVHNRPVSVRDHARVRDGVRGRDELRPWRIGSYIA